MRRGDGESEVSVSWTKDIPSAIDLLIVFSVLGVEALAGLDRDNSDQGVQLVGGVLVFVALAAEANADAVRDIADTLRPDGLVQVGVDADVLSQHHLAGEGLDLLDGAGCALLEGAAKED